MGLGFRYELRQSPLDLNLRGVVLSRHGRLSRVAFAGVAFLIFLMSVPVWYGVVVAWGLVANLMGTAAYSIGIPFMAVVAAANAYPAGCVVVKRIHDMDRSGHHAWWVLPVLVAGTICWATAAEGWAADASRICGLVVFALLLLAPGSEDTNSHGTVDNWC